jgi:hypothetical protein
MLTPEKKAEMRALLMAAFVPKPKPKPPAKVIKLVHSKPDTPIEDAIAATRKAETWIEKQLRLKRELDEEQMRLSNDGVANRHMAAAYRRGQEAAPQARPNPDIPNAVIVDTHAAEVALQATHNARMALTRYAVSGNIGGGDPDYNDHLSAEEQIWGRS